VELGSAQQITMCKQTWNKCDTVCDTELDNNPPKTEQCLFIGEK